MNSGKLELAMRLLFGFSHGADHRGATSDAVALGRADRARACVLAGGDDAAPSRDSRGETSRRGATSPVTPRSARRCVCRDALRRSPTRARPGDRSRALRSVRGLAAWSGHGAQRARGYGGERALDQAEGAIGPGRERLAANAKTAVHLGCIETAEQH